MNPRDYMNQINACAAGIDRLACAIAKTAQRGMPSDAKALDALSEASDRLKQLRAGLIAALAAKADDARTLENMTLDELEMRVEECELSDRMCDEIGRRICDALEMLGKLGAPDCGAAAPEKLAESTRAALQARDFRKLRSLEAEAAPYTDMCTLLRGGVEAVRVDAGLLKRMERWYPQIVWYIRTRNRIEQGTGCMDDSGLEAEAARLKQLKFTSRRNVSKADDGYGCLAAAVGTAAAKQPRVEWYRPLADKLRAMRDNAGEPVRPDRLKAEFPELDALQTLAAALENDAPRQRLTPLIERAIEQAGEYAAVLDDAGKWLEAPRPPRPECGGINQHIWDTLLMPEDGLISGALGAIYGRRRNEYERVHKLCGQVMLSGQPSGVRLEGLRELIEGAQKEFRTAAGLKPEPIKAEAIIEWLSKLKPALMVLGRWRALVKSTG